MNFYAASASELPQIAVAGHQDALMHFSKPLGKAVIQAQLSATPRMDNESVGHRSLEEGPDAD